MSGNRIDTAVKALDTFLSSLPEHSYFNIISFGSSFTKLYAESQINTPESLQKTKLSISSFSADLGGTEIF